MKGVEGLGEGLVARVFEERVDFLECEIINTETCFTIGLMTVVLTPTPWFPSTIDGAKGSIITSSTTYSLSRSGTVDILYVNFSQISDSNLTSTMNTKDFQHNQSKIPPSNVLAAR